MCWPHTPSENALFMHAAGAAQRRPRNTAHQCHQLHSTLRTLPRLCGRRARMAAMRAAVQRAAGREAGGVAHIRSRPPAVALGHLAARRHIRRLSTIIRAERDDGACGVHGADSTACLPPCCSLTSGSPWAQSARRTVVRAYWRCNSSHRHGYRRLLRVVRAVLVRSPSASRVADNQWPMA